MKTERCCKSDLHKKSPRLALADKPTERGYRFVLPKTFEGRMWFSPLRKSKSPLDKWLVDFVSVDDNRNSGDGAGVSSMWNMGIGGVRGGRPFGRVWSQAGSMDQTVIVENNNGARERWKMKNKIWGTYFGARLWTKFNKTTGRRRECQFVSMMDKIA